MDKPSFDELKHLAQSHPAAFERLRAELVEDLIANSAPKNQKRLRGLQFGIDARRNLANNPMKALIEIQARMHTSFARLNRILQSTLGPNRGESHCPVSNSTPDNIIPFHR